MAKSGVTLSLAHNIFLTEKQRYSLHEGKRLVVVGVSLPVWFYRGKTSEPAEEVFCKYILTNIKNKTASINTTKCGYKINLPQVPDSFMVPELTNEEWRAMSEKVRSEWYTKHKRPLGSWKLLNPIDGGSREMRFKITENLKLSEFRYKVDKTNVIHMVMIKDYDAMCQSLTHSPSI